MYMVHIARTVQPALPSASPGGREAPRSKTLIVIVIVIVIIVILIE